MEHHEIADLFPLRSEDEFYRLVGDLAVNGQQEPIVLFEGKILDGRKRYRAFQVLGFDGAYEQFSGDFQQAWQYLVRANRVVQRFSESQRAMASVRIADLAAQRESA